MSTTTKMSRSEALEALNSARLAESNARKDKNAKIVGTEANTALKAAKKARREAVSVCRSLGIMLTDTGVLLNVSDSENSLTHVEIKRAVIVRDVANKLDVSVEEVEKLYCGKLSYKNRMNYAKNLEALVEHVNSFDVLDD